ncbi:hypothetical protein RE428_07690 [Marinobacter nanhaiticus D15-8W]|uniref:Uncharacterized protein n=1 Tax=Marinobacter nanhaiticus D15-8W TaxID=626887 RepID=N6X0M9_9GAMM|nr:hypothetical protein [Marinobacter nanhaiticus]ENO14608.1 hypothetical protein J057_04636 [Marinobacter nanhaiticus D15-8W]BES69706.1 hypothetical protein RE428_07240 [Marinobacter nanhaiticus D15-8W]BES69751.1 hypothetical protein RE428_07690 [Marinobacter nanhaiticus D15-8W]
MELKDFIRETLVQLAQGIEEANMELRSSAAVVNPENVIVDVTGKAKHYGILSASDDIVEYLPSVQAIEFDVAVHATEGKEKSAKGGISVGAMNIGGSGGASESKSSESRIQFKIPMVLPHGK